MAVHPPRPWVQACRTHGVDELHQGVLRGEKRTVLVGVMETDTAPHQATRPCAQPLRVQGVVLLDWLVQPRCPPPPEAVF